jgi:hypothetical protein
VKQENHRQERAFDIRGCLVYRSSGFVAYLRHVKTILYALGYQWSVPNGTLRDFFDLVYQGLVLSAPVEGMILTISESRSADAPGVSDRSEAKSRTQGKGCAFAKASATRGRGIANLVKRGLLLTNRLGVLGIHIKYKPLPSEGGIGVGSKSKSKT